MTAAGAERWTPGEPFPATPADGGSSTVSRMVFLAGGRGRARDTRRVPLTSFHNASAAAILDAVVASADNIPASYEARGWQFAIRHGGIELELDRSRGTTSADTGSREAIVRCGTALQQARIALRYWGFADRVMLLPDPENADILARLEAGRASPPTTRDERLHATIPERHTPRDAAASAAVGARMLAALAHAADSEGARLTSLTTDQLRSSVRLLLEEGDRRGGTAREFRRQLAAWLTPADWTLRIGRSDLAHHVGRLLSRLIPAGLRAAGPEDQHARPAPVFAVLGTSGDAPRDWLIAGQALQLVLLTARAHGVAASFRIVPAQLPRLRAHLAGLVRPGGVPQAIVRLGYTPASLRRLGRAIQIAV